VWPDARSPYHEPRKKQSDSQHLTVGF